MSTVVDTLARMLAHRERRAVVIRQTATLAPDPRRVFAPATGKASAR